MTAKRGRHPAASPGVERSIMMVVFIKAGLIFIASHVAFVLFAIMLFAEA